MKDILFYKEGTAEFPSFFSENLILEWLEVIAKHYNRKLGDLNFIFCDDEYMISVNRKYLNHDYYTDVITFDYCRGDILSGDIFISLDTVISNYQKFGTEFREEFHRVVCHSVLHLIGYKDKTDPDAAEMRKNENICLDLLKTL